MSLLRDILDHGGALVLVAIVFYLWGRASRHDDY